MLDWPAILTSRGVPFVSSGHNVVRGNINVKCPFCTDDPSEHMGLFPGGGWACWRNRDHRGRNPARLLVALLGVPWHVATELAGQEPQRDTTLDELSRELGALESEGPQRQRPPIPELPPRLSYRQATSRFFAYLAQRGFAMPDHSELVDLYDVRAAVSGELENRLVFPIWDLAGGLVGCTGRAVGRHPVRYLTLPAGGETKRHLFNGWLASSGGHVLAVVEGPLDAVKLDFYGRAHGVRAVALMGLSWTAAQVSTLCRLAQRFDGVAVLLDRGETGPAIRLCEQLALPLSAIYDVPAKDPGDLAPTEVGRVAAALVEKVFHNFDETGKRG